MVKLLLWLLLLVVKPLWADMMVSTTQLPESPFLCQTYLLGKNAIVELRRIKAKKKTISSTLLWRSFVETSVSNPVIYNQSVVYFIAGNMLNALNLMTGQKRSETILHPPSANFIIEPKLTLASFQQNGALKTLLAGLSNREQPYLFVYAEGKHLLWGKPVAYKNLTPPQFVRFKNGSWGVMLAGTIGLKAVISFYSAETGQLINTLVLPLSNSSREEFKPYITAIDALGRGYVDYLYVNINNALWKINMDAYDPFAWYTEKKVYDAIDNGFVSTPQVIPHSSGQGNIVYSIVEDSMHKAHKILAIGDGVSGYESKILWQYPSMKVLSQPLLRNRLLTVYLTNREGKNIVTFDAESGEILSTHQTSFLSYSSDGFINNIKPFFYQKYLSQPMTVILPQPKSFESYIVLEDSEGIKVAKASLDGNKLGRKSWIELSKYQ